MPAAENSEACIACGKSRAVLILVAARRGEYYLCAECAANPGAEQFTTAQRIIKTKKGKR